MFSRWTCILDIPSTHEHFSNYCSRSEVKSYRTSKVPNESPIPGLYSPGKLFCIRFQFWGFLEVFPTSVQPAIFFGAPYFRHRACDVVENGMVERRREFCIDWIAHCYTKWLNISENEWYRKWENAGYGANYNRAPDEFFKIAGDTKFYVKSVE